MVIILPAEFTTTVADFPLYLVVPSGRTTTFPFLIASMYALGATPYPFLEIAWFKAWREKLVARPPVRELNVEPRVVIVMVAEAMEPDRDPLEPPTPPTTRSPKLALIAS